MSPETQSPNYHFEQLEISIEFQSIEAEEEQGPYYTYLIIDPRTQMPFYVGQTHDMEHRKSAIYVILTNIEPIKSGLQVSRRMASNRNSRSLIYSQQKQIPCVQKPNG